MNDYVLFSPVGGTDPISNLRDGALLHICRQYRPRMVYLYISAEMLERHQLDNRYCFCLDKLRESLGISMEYRIIERPDLEDVQLFDPFYHDFGELIGEIQRENPASCLLLNISSGTPAMKSALMVLSVLNEDKLLRAIQVDTPMKKQNPHVEGMKDYDPAEYWEINEDNLPDTKDRTRIFEGPHLKALLRKELVYNCLDTYDYEAARALGRGLDEFLTDEAKRLLEAAACRLQLDQSGVGKALGDLEDIRVKLPGDKRDVAEYLLWLQIKQKRGDLSDFLRGLTPVIVKLFEIYLRDKSSIDIYKFCSVGRSGEDFIHKLRRDKLQETDQGRAMLAILDTRYPSGGYKDSALSSEYLCLILEEMCGNPTIREQVRWLRDAETKARNCAAHTIVSVTEEMLKKRVGSDSEQIMKALRSMAAACGFGKNLDWASYDQMNERIKAEIGKQV